MTCCIAVVMWLYIEIVNSYPSLIISIGITGGRNDDYFAIIGPTFTCLFCDCFIISDFPIAQILDMLPMYTASADAMLFQLHPVVTLCFRKKLPNFVTLHLRDEWTNFDKIICICAFYVYVPRL